MDIIDTGDLPLEKAPLEYADWRYKETLHALGASVAWENGRPIYDSTDAPLMEETWVQVDDEAYAVYRGNPDLPDLCAAALYAAGLPADHDPEHAAREAGLVHDFTYHDTNAAFEWATRYGE